MGEQGEWSPAFASLPVIVIETLSSAHSDVIPDYRPTGTHTAFHAQTLLKHEQTTKTVWWELLAILILIMQYSTLMVQRILPFVS